MRHLRLGSAPPVATNARKTDRSDRKETEHETKHEEHPPARPGKRPLADTPKPDGLDPKHEYEVLHRKASLEVDRLVKQRDQAYGYAEGLYRGLHQAEREGAHYKQQLLSGITNEKDYRMHLDELSQGLHDSQLALQAERATAEQYRKEVTLSHAQISDDEIVSKADAIFYGVQDFAVSATRSTKQGLDIRQAPPYVKKWLGEHAEMSAHIPKQRLKFVIMCLVAGIVFDCWDNPEYCFDSSSQPVLVAARGLAMTLGSQSADLSTWIELTLAGSDSSSRAWLHTTRHPPIKTDPEIMHRSDQTLVDGTMARLCDALRTVLPSAMDSSAAKELQKICASALELFRKLQTTKPRFVSWWPSIINGGERARFDEKCMRSVMEEERDLNGEPFLVSVFPAILKYGDEYGDKEDEETVVRKATVLMQAGVPL
ncbi:hypothetical protein LTR62_005744 [Meristemomyces frigidus]|uniref:Uncharacterized protein n=1 Tax=Meristemomyces frigidus TaxID=1508187 RepID=A0AAN7YF37_9PEZI|nr:hypothetical protein LTR62_005744 [Meristemomyces frigidus]